MEMIKVRIIAVVNLIARRTLLITIVITNDVIVTICILLRVITNTIIIIISVCVAFVAVIFPLQI